jgi:hypothetical protein
MDVEAWLSASFGEVIAVDDLTSSAAASFARFVDRHAAELAAVVALRRGGAGELVELTFRTGRPQQSVVSFRRTERLGVRFAGGDTMPFVYVLRSDFPDTAHQNLTAEGSPRAICIDDRSWAEARLTWTPAELVHRILTWFRRAAEGALHDARQPVDPLMFGTGYNIIMSRALIENANAQDLVAVPDDTGTLMRVIPLAKLDGRALALPLTVAAYRVPPTQMVRLSFAPGNLGSLADLLTARGIDLFADLRARLSGWLNDAKTNAARINSCLAVIVEMPITTSDGTQQGTDFRAFVSADKVGGIAVALGIAHKAESKDQGGAAGFVPALTAGAVDEAALIAMAVLPVEVHATLDRDLATRLAGRTVPDERGAVIVGGGAIGAHVAPCLAREGRFRWTVIDDDVLLPHNLARHIGFGGDVTRRKSELLAWALTSILDDEVSASTAISAHVGVEGQQSDDVDRALDGADIIVDASASLLAERFLSDHQSKARRFSIFFSPAGDAAVLLAEPKDRSVTLRDLEAQYLRHVVREEALAGHLETPVRTFAYTGACRAITNLIPESRVMALSGLVAEGLGRAADSDEGVIRIWSLGTGGEVRHVSYPAEDVRRFDVDGWQVALDAGLRSRIAAMRDECLPNETGGILLGVVDIPARKIHLADAAKAPADSTGSPTGFVRGTDGVQQMIDRSMAETQGQLRYVGEWHSHPPQAGVMPSITDLSQINWLATIFDMDTLPGLMLIAGEAELAVVFVRRGDEASPLADGSGQ